MTHTRNRKRNLSMLSASLLTAMLALPALAAPAAGIATAKESPAPAKPNLLYLGSWQHVINIIDADQGKVIDTINVQTEVVRQLLLTPDHKSLIVGGLRGNCILTVDIAARKQTDGFCLDHDNIEERVSGMTLDPTGKYIYSLVTTYTKQLDHYDISEPKMAVIDIQNKRISRRFDMPKEVTSGSPYRGAIKISPDGRHLYIFRDSILVFDTSTFKLVKTIDLKQSPVTDVMNLSLNFEEDPNEDPNKAVGIFRSEDPYQHAETFGIGELNLNDLTFNLTTLGPVTTASMSGLYLTPDRKTAYAAIVEGERGNRVTKFISIDLATRKIIAEKTFNGRTRFNFGITADGKKLLIYNAGFQVEVYDAKTMEMVKDIELNGDTTSNLVVMPLGS